MPVSKPNARGEPRPKAVAQRRLEGVGSTAMFGPPQAGKFSGLVGNLNPTAAVSHGNHPQMSVGNQ